jgi:hypothetical protein
MIKITYIILGIVSLVAVIGTASISLHAFAQITGNLTSTKTPLTSSLNSAPLTTSPNTAVLSSDTAGLQKEIQDLTTTAKTDAQQLQTQAQSIQSNAQNLGNSFQSQINSPLGSAQSTPAK